MLFSVTILGLAALAVAAPSQSLSELEARQPSQFGARGLTWTPRDLRTRDEKDGRDRDNNRDGNNRNKNNNDDLITITQTETIQLTEIQRGREVQLTQVIQKQIQIVDQKKRARDNVRKNHYRNRNRNQNTVIIIVTQVIDVRDSNNRNDRFLARQIRADNDPSFEDVAVVMTEIEQLTVGAGQVQTVASDGLLQAAALATGVSAAPAIATYNPAAIPGANQTQMLPIGASAPNWGLQVENDPAMIIEADQSAMVAFQ
ncbi:hypothetical protein PVAG01_04048 [Phlyctema vagabunda]|uniref:Uncharacterized protein n=1 Tax=Phlyctema vagabunda TaxID=108571 RepID=A0ABR4PN48_9HELO